MKQKSASQSAFFNPRVLIGVFIALAGVFMALLSFGVFSPANTAQAQQGKIIISPQLQILPPGFDCSRIHALGIDKQENLRAGAIMIACGEVGKGEAAAIQTSPASAFSPLIKKMLSPEAYGGTDVDLVTGTEHFPNVTQSETYSSANPDNANQIVVAYNDSRGINSNPINISAVSVSTDGGTTFTRVTGANGQSPFANTFGDPVVIYNKPTSTWFTVWIDGACGGGGMGGYKSTNPSDATSWTHFPCVRSTSAGDRESGWADNNPSSSFYGRMYVSYNDFNVGGGALFVSRSTDNGTTWTATQLNPSFIRDVQITGDSATGDVYVAAMNENGGGSNYNRNNVFYRSTDGGATWANTYTGPTFQGPHDGTLNCNTFNTYFATMFGNYWRHMGWGEPAVFNHVVSYVYAAHGTGSDAGDVYYIRSTDSGVTFSAPLLLNTDGTTTRQWQPNLSVSPAGTLLATWYDGRNGTSCTPGANTPCYQMFSRKSNDNGVTWQPDMPLSDVVSPLPAQTDPGIVPCYAGDYDYGSAILTKHVTSWVDGRVAISGSQQQDTFTDRELVGFAVTGTVPACNSFITTQPTSFTVNLSDAADPNTVQASDFMVNNIPANSFTLMQNNTQIIFTFNTSPVTTPGVQTMHIPAGAINRTSDGMGIFEFLCTFCYAQTALQVTSTNPPVNGTFSPPAPGDYPYDVNFNQAVDPSSVQTSDLTITGNVGGSVTSVTLTNGNTTAHFMLHFNFGGSVTLSIAAGAITAEGCNGNAAFSGNYTVLGCPPQDHYTISQIGGSIVLGTTDSGNHGDDVVTTIALPFSYSFYDQAYNAITVSSNGNGQFVSTNNAFTNECLPSTTIPSYAIFPHWDDLRTDQQTGCSAYPNGQCGVFTSVTGSPPNRVFNIEWRAVYFASPGQHANFELRLYEGQTRFDVIYGAVDLGNSSATAGVQKSSSAFDQYFCNGSGGAATGGQSYILQSCAPQVTDAVSRKTHGAAGTFDIDLPLTGTTGVESRSGGATDDYTMVVTFSGNVAVTGTPQAQVTLGTGCVGSGGVCDPNGLVSISGNVVTIPLTTIADVQTINVTLHGVMNGASDAPDVDVTIPMSILIGDVTANRTVNASDVALTKAQVGQSVGNGNFREDVNANGTITATDVAIVKSDVGHSLPP